MNCGDEIFPKIPSSFCVIEKIGSEIRPGGGGCYLDSLDFLDYSIQYVGVRLV